MGAYCTEQSTFVVVFEHQGWNPKWPIQSISEHSVSSELVLSPFDVLLLDP